MSSTSQKAKGAVTVLVLVAATMGVLLALSSAFGLSWYQSLEHLPRPVFLAAVVVGTLCEIWAAILIAGSVLVRFGIWKPKTRG